MAKPPTPPPPSHVVTGPIPTWALPPPTGYNPASLADTNKMQPYYQEGYVDGGGAALLPIRTGKPRPKTGSGIGFVIDSALPQKWRPRSETLALLTTRGRRAMGERHLSHRTDLIVQRAAPRIGRLARDAAFGRPATPATPGTPATPRDRYMPRFTTAASRKAGEIWRDPGYYGEGIAPKVARKLGATMLGGVGVISTLALGIPLATTRFLGRRRR